VRPEDCHPMSRFDRIDHTPKTLSFSRDLLERRSFDLRGGAQAYPNGRRKEMGLAGRSAGERGPERKSSVAVGKRAGVSESGFETSRYAAKQRASSNAK
jgi:hypothetical protein